MNFEEWFKNFGYKGMFETDSGYTFPKDVEAMAKLLQLAGWDARGDQPIKILVKRGAHREQLCRILGMEGYKIWTTEEEDAIAWNPSKFYINFEPNKEK